MKNYLFLFVCLFSTAIYADDDVRRVRVPSEITLGDMKLKISEGARRNIQKDVDALTKSPRFMEIKADRARIYFPIIEQVFKEEGIPSDFKFLALQESALISDAVSSSNAVGFWQFKDFTGREVGLRIDRSVDERLNIVASTHGAAKYFKRHNFYFDNWVYTILAHMTGRGGAGKYVDKGNFGKKHMTLDGKTHWYVIRFLAHKIAYEGITGGPSTEGLSLVEYRNGKGKTLSSIAKETKVDQEELVKYNKWLKANKVPDEKPYSVMLPVRGKAPKIRTDRTVPQQKGEEGGNDGLIAVKIYPTIDKDLNISGTIYIKINGLPSILAKRGDGINALAKKANLTPERFAKYNDLNMNSIIKEGEIYYTRSKRNRAKIYFYTVQPKETLWDVSQKFGIKLVKLAKLNRMATIDEIKPGRVLWLHKKRPANMPIEYRELPKMQVDEAVPVKKTAPVAVVPIPPIKEAQKEAQKEVKEASDEIAETVTEQIDEVIETVSELDEPMEITSHVVAKGETLYGIAKSMGVSVEDLVEWNNLYDTSLKLGQKLIVHGTVKENTQKPDKSEVNFHIVEPGETLYGISKKYGVSIQQILDMNQKDNLNLDIGERLRVR
ncbi:LysM peptidoglycan-binding domain-containing protein [Reichenbachiella carrageenanivorans]|uniref:LysM peptidoglycan-binding domain-containing protein n=1 Tax=Reichenbachiella carrageenanivorans TaxID=2979869 RepID=A0ABY6CYB0_9BACT|nr:LysM peptidoglycan-binding domain-containing protein [Reichenbachiella carrageenanivorans]UXX78901.1 LysM peptidoglycan-binding domain-containing protein [Reichenbachiella carrageenanivorans]